ncbi:hypothetical protein WG66_003479 [Moniliophthora roreri]|nr:hypothetical protein WG66_003479 [Moniliophthora roreri]
MLLRTPLERVVMGVSCLDIRWHRWLEELLASPLVVITDITPGKVSLRMTKAASPCYSKRLIAAMLGIEAASSVSHVVLLQLSTRLSRKGFLPVEDDGLLGIPKTMIPKPTSRVTRRIQDAGRLS